MQIVVQKYGGSSVGTAERIGRVADRILAACRQGAAVVAVVSAMGDSTDDLLALAHQVHPRPPARELDMLLSTGEQVSVALLAMAVEARGVQAVSLTGWQAGIDTDGSHRKARIRKVRPTRILKELEQGRVVIVAGFQGLSRSRDLTTLGRGGSDMTAVAVAAALQAGVCEIYSDVEGVYTADPRVVPEARKLAVLGYDEMLELASLGAQVLQRGSVEYAKQYGVVIHARSTFSENSGTLIGEVNEMAKTRMVTGVAADVYTAKVCVLGIPDRPGTAFALFRSLAAHGVNVDMIIQSQSRDGTNDICFTVGDEDLPLALDAATEVKEALQAREVVQDPRVAKVSVVGAGMASNPGVASALFAAFAREGINIEMISTSEIKISCLVRREDAPQAVRAAHKAFHLEESAASPSAEEPLAPSNRI